MPKTSTRWLILILCTFTTMIVFTIPTLMLPVLFAEMAADLDLDILQLGVAWGSISLSSMLVGLFGGAIGDRFGSKRTLGVVCLLTGVLGAVRGLSSSFPMLVATFMIYSLIAPSLPPNLHKTGAHFFPERRGISTGVISFGFAVALFLGSRYMATLLSPLLGGWRNVLYLFGVLGLLFSFIWFVLIPDDLLPQPTNTDQPFFGAIFKSLGHILKLRKMWIIGIASTLFWACYRGFAGYTPLYLRGLGWDAVAADSALSNFFLASLIFAIPIVYLSERSNNRRPYLIVAMLSSGLGVLLIGLGAEVWIPASMVLAGFMFDAFMAIHQAEILDMPEVGAYAGSALGVIVMFREAGGFLSPPIGNWLAQFGTHIPFIFWGTMGLLAAIMFLFLPIKKTS